MITPLIAAITCTLVTILPIQGAILLRQLKETEKQRRLWRIRQENAQDVELRKKRYLR